MLNSCCTSAFNAADKSTPHVGHAKVMGFRAISGVASNAYFAPQSQVIFISVQGLGFNSTMFEASGRGMGVNQSEERVLPSQNKKLPPYL